MRRLQMKTNDVIKDLRQIVTHAISFVITHYTGQFSVNVKSMETFLNSHQFYRYSLIGVGFPLDMTLCKGVGVKIVVLLV